MNREASVRKIESGFRLIEEGLAELDAGTDARCGSRRRSRCGDGSIDETADGGFRVRMTVMGRRRSLGVYPTREEAERMRAAMAVVLAESESRKPTGKVYFIEAVGTGTIKIGFSGRKLGKRLASIQSGCPHTIQLLASADGDEHVESDLHNRFSHLRLRGERFRSDPELLGFIEDVRRRGAFFSRRTARKPAHE